MVFTVWSLKHKTTNSCRSKMAHHLFESYQFSLKLWRVLRYSSVLGLSSLNMFEHLQVGIWLNQCGWLGQPRFHEIPFNHFPCTVDDLTFLNFLNGIIDHLSVSRQACWDCKTISLPSATSTTSIILLQAVKNRVFGAASNFGCLAGNWDWHRPNSNKDTVCGQSADLTCDEQVIGRSEYVLGCLRGKFNRSRISKRLWHIWRIFEIPKFGTGWGLKKQGGLAFPSHRSCSGCPCCCSPGHRRRPRHRRRPGHRARRGHCGCTAGRRSYGWRCWGTSAGSTQDAGRVGRLGCGVGESPPGACFRFPWGGYHGCGWFTITVPFNTNSNHNCKHG